MIFFFFLEIFGKNSSEELFADKNEFVLMEKDKCGCVHHCGLWEVE